MKNKLIFSTLLILLTITYQSFAQSLVSQSSVKITGELTSPLDLKISDLDQYAQTEVMRTDKDGKEHRYSGVVLSAILQKAGVTLGSELKGKNLTKYVEVTAADGYQVVFALAELDKNFTDRLVILANKADGKPLLPSEGPFRIIVQDEKKPARCVRQVTGIRVLISK
ncbi:molybdopterin-dependent oxidoreductase [Mucilaginibacter xinganensis]|uniref:Molybdopterin-binding protein n=1 Tax=Mucilaginibacter xinganensis TaxID=1234841 RepID=A0A223NZA1_9SPHI|nr:molybdopterin-dependent oxidoreductase [Mucilaginibacter xinganensis]ASU34908.1 molybdopterin-binding protein [Mucilaginibacter xinganensis]